MLISKQKDLPCILVFKTQSGEEFIAKVVEETSDVYKITNPLCIVAAENGLRFAPFLMMADPVKSVSIPKPVITAFPTSTLESQYESSMTGIALPQKSAIIV